MANNTTTTTTTTATKIKTIKDLKKMGYIDISWERSFIATRENGNFAVFDICEECGGIFMTGDYSNHEKVFDCAVEMVRNQRNDCDCEERLERLEKEQMMLEQDLQNELDYQ